MSKFSFSQIIGFTFNFLTSGLARGAQSVIMLDPQFKKADKEYRQAVLKLQSLQEQYCRLYPNSAKARIRNEEKKSNSLYYQNYKIIKAEAENNKYK